MVSGWPNLSGSVDSVFLFITVISVVLLVGITGVMVYFAVKYNRKKNPTPSDIEGNLFLEVLWTVIPTLLVLAIFYYGWEGFKLMRKAPPDAMPVKVTARQFSWSFEYENGKKSDVLLVPLKKPVKLTITSADVIHSLFIPAFRVKEDAVPGMETYLWFLPDEVGTYDLFCTEYCGEGHAAMITKVQVVPEAEFKEWYGAEARETEIDKGLRLLQERGCLGCHSTDGTKKIGPTFKGLFGSRVTVVTAGKTRTVTADEAYISKSVLDPGADVVKDYPPVMPRVEVNQEELEAIIAYLKELK
jgi:cytochrome c oxidase subunit 2